MAQVVLLDSDFGKMPSIVAEGRRVVNNIQRSASLFLIKNIFSILLAISVTLLAFTYPIMPSQMSLISGFTIGIPGFFLALEPNSERIKGRFIETVFKNALPAAFDGFYTDLQSGIALFSIWHEAGRTLECSHLLDGLRWFYHHLPGIPASQSLQETGSSRKYPSLPGFK